MARILERSEIEKQLKSINWKYVSPEYPLIHEEHNFVFLNPKGDKVKFRFSEIYQWIYDEDYVGCGYDCDRCLTPIC